MAVVLVSRYARPRRFLVLAAATVLAAGCSAANRSAPDSQSTSSKPPTVTGQSTSGRSGAAGPSSGTAGHPLDHAALQAALDDARTRVGFPGVIARVITPAGSWEGSSGTTEKGGTTPVTASDHTRIGSITKTMTATILLQLVQEGKLSLDDPVSKYIPGLPNGDATLRQVADMTSGIPSYTLDNKVTDRYLAAPQTSWTPDQLLDAVRTLPPSFPTGKGWQYSNSNYIVLGVIISKVTGQPIAEVFRDRIFTPLGMSQSSYPTGTAIPAPYLSGVTTQGATAGSTRDATGFDPSFAGTAGQVVSTLDDLQRWATALFTGQGVLNPQTQQLRRDSILTSPPPNTATAGYGIGIGNRNGWWGHDGDIPGYTTSLFHDYDTDTTIIVLVNSDVEDKASGQAPAPFVFSSLVSALGM